MGNKDLTKLWNLCPDNLEAASAPERDFLPSMDEYLSEAVEQLDPAQQVCSTIQANSREWPIILSLFPRSFLVEGKRQAGSSHLNEKFSSE